MGAVVGVPLGLLGIGAGLSVALATVPEGDGETGPELPLFLFSGAGFSAGLAAVPEGDGETGPELPR